MAERIHWILKKLVRTNSVNRPTAAGDGNIQEEKPENELRVRQFLSFQIIH